MKINGIDSVLAGLKDLETVTKKKIVRKGLTVGANYFKTQALAVAPMKSGITKANIKVRSGRTQGKKGILSKIIGIGQKWYVGDTFYAAFLEFGHRQGKRSLGNKRKQIEGLHWLEKCYDANKETAAQITVDAMLEAIADFNAKGAK